MRILLRVGVVLLLAFAAVLLFARGQDDWLILALVGCAVVALVVDRWVRRTEPDDLAEDDDFDDEIETGEIERIPEGLEAIPEARLDEVPEAAPGALRAELHESVAGEPFNDAEPAEEVVEAEEFEETAEAEEAAGAENGAAARSDGEDPTAPPATTGPESEEPAPGEPAPGAMADRER